MSDTTQATAGNNADVPGTATGTQQPTEPATPTTNPAPATEPTAALPRTYTEEQYQSMSTSQYRAGINAVMKEAGFEPTRGEDFKTQLKAFRTWLDEQKTDEEKQADAVRQTQEALSAEQAKTQTLERKLTALGKGVPAEKLDRYAAIAATYMTDDVDFAAALDKALEDFPLPVERGVPKVVMGAVGNNNTPGKDWLKMSLTERAALYRERPEDARALAKQAGQTLAE